MKTNNTSRTKTVIILILIFIIIVFVGRIILAHQTQENSSSHAATTSPNISSSSEAAVSGGGTEQNSSTTDTQSALAACAETLKADALKNKTDYAAGTILVSFTTSLSFPDAKLLLAHNGAGIQNEANARDSFSGSHILTATIPEGQEFKEICILKNNPDIKYAGLNTYFSLHE